MYIEEKHISRKYRCIDISIFVQHPLCILYRVLNIFTSISWTACLRSLRNIAKKTKIRNNFTIWISKSWMNWFHPVDVTNYVSLTRTALVHTHGQFFLINRVIFSPLFRGDHYQTDLSIGSKKPSLRVTVCPKKIFWILSFESQRCPLSRHGTALKYFQNIRTFFMTIIFF